MSRKWYHELLGWSGKEEWRPEVWGHSVCECCEYPTLSSDEEEFCILCRWIYAGENYRSLTVAQKEFSDLQKEFKPLIPDDNKVTKPEKISAKMYELVELLERLKANKTPADSSSAKNEISDKIQEIEKLKGYA